ncbi:hypothetical protein BD408DRAFT_443764 [Parasitella parasitica]|nr:hypothetical protein BD408DRAFT_443764 [Parasitella parasitica]
MKKHEKEYQNSQKYFTTKAKLDLCGNTSIFITPKIRSVFGNMQYNYVSYMQGTKHAITPIHTNEEVKLYHKLRLTDSLASGINQSNYWQKFAAAWSKELNDNIHCKFIFYKTAESLKQHFDKTKDKSKYYNSLQFNEEKVNTVDEILNNNSRKRKHTNDILPANDYLQFPGTNSSFFPSGEPSNSNKKPKLSLLRIEPSTYVIPPSKILTRNMPQNHQSMYPFYPMPPSFNSMPQSVLQYLFLLPYASIYAKIYLYVTTSTYAIINSSNYATNPIWLS